MHTSPLAAQPTEAPLFSIVVPTYNRAARLMEALRRVQNQTLPDFECLVVDDGSTDNTAEQVQALAGQDGRFVYLYQENAERGAARNRGTRNARGRYVYFLDSDDWLLPHHLAHGAETLAALGSPPVLHSSFAWVRDDAPDAPVPQRYPTGPPERWLWKRNHYGCYLFVERGIALELPFSEDRQLIIGEDWHLVLRLLARFDTLHRTSQITRHVVAHAGQTMVGTPPEKIEASRKLLLTSLTSDSPFMTRFGSKRGAISSELFSLTALEAAIRGRRAQAARALAYAAANCPAALMDRRSLAVAKHLLLSFFWKNG